MIFERPTGPAHARLIRPARQRIGDQARRQRRGIEEVETIGAVEVILARRIGLHLLLGEVAAHLRHGEDRAIAVGEVADARDEIDHAGMRLAVTANLIVERPGAWPFPLGRGRIVAQFRVVHRMVERIEAKAVDAPVQPELHRAQQRILHRNIVNVELRLAGQELVHIILPPPRIPGPGRAAKHRLPVVGRRAVRPGIGPDEPVCLVIVPVLPALRKPGMQVGTMGIDLVDRDLDPQFMRARHQRVEIGERAEDRVHPAIISDIIAEIAHRRGEEGRNPDRVHAQPGDMLQPRGDARQVANAVTVRILKAARIDLIEDRALPPGPIACITTVGSHLRHPMSQACGASCRSASLHGGARR